MIYHVAQPPFCISQNVPPCPLGESGDPYFYPGMSGN